MLQKIPKEARVVAYWGVCYGIGEVGEKLFASVARVSQLHGQGGDKREVGDWTPVPKQSQEGMQCSMLLVAGSGIGTPLRVYDKHPLLEQLFCDYSGQSIRAMMLAHKYKINKRTKEVSYPCVYCTATGPELRRRPDPRFLPFLSYLDRPDHDGTKEEQQRGTHEPDFPAGSEKCPFLGFNYDRLVQRLNQSSVHSIKDDADIKSER